MIPATGEVTIAAFRHDNPEGHCQGNEVECIFSGFLIQNAAEKFMENNVTRSRDDGQKQVFGVALTEPRRCI